MSIYKRATYGRNTLWWPTRRQTCPHEAIRGARDLLILGSGDEYAAHGTAQSRQNDQVANHFGGNRSNMGSLGYRG